MHCNGKKKSKCNEAVTLKIFVSKIHFFWCNPVKYSLMVMCLSQLTSSSIKLWNPAENEVFSGLRSYSQFRHVLNPRENVSTCMPPLMLSLGTASCSSGASLTSRDSWAVAWEHHPGIGVLSQISHALFRNPLFIISLFTGTLTNNGISCTVQ